MYSVHFFFVCFSCFLGLRTFEKNPTGQQVTGLSSLACTECIPVQCKALCCSPDTMTHSITDGSRIVWLWPAPYNASIHPSHFPPDWHPISGFTGKEQDWHFFSRPHSWRDKSPGILHGTGEEKKNYALRRFWDWTGNTL